MNVLGKTFLTATVVKIVIVHMIENQTFIAIMMRLGATILTWIVTHWAGIQLVNLWNTEKNPKIKRQFRWKEVPYTMLYQWQAVVSALEINQWIKFNVLIFILHNFSCTLFSKYKIFIYHAQLAKWVIMSLTGNEGPDQTAHVRSLIRAFVTRLQN